MQQKVSHSLESRRIEKTFKEYEVYLNSGEHREAFNNTEYELCLAVWDSEGRWPTNDDESPLNKMGKYKLIVKSVEYGEFYFNFYLSYEFLTDVIEEVKSGVAKNYAEESFRLIKLQKTNSVES